jgi:hypothetical protein
MVCTTWFQTSKESGPKEPGFGPPPERASILFPPCGSLLEWWSFAEYQIPNAKSQGFRCQEKETQKLKPEH